MYKIAKSSLLSLVLTIAFITTSSNTKADQCSDCDTSFHSCNQACSLIGAKGVGCKLACLITSYVCRYQNCPHQYALRNASVYTMNFFRSDNHKLGTLGGVSPDRITVEYSDFPITATYCSDDDYLSKDPKKAYCHTDNHYSYVYNDEGCYILWYAGGYYTTDELCYIKDQEGTATPPPSFLSESMKKDLLNKKLTIPSTLPPSPGSKGNDLPNQKDTVPSTVPPSPQGKETKKP